MGALTRVISFAVNLQSRVESFLNCFRSKSVGKVSRQSLTTMTFSIPSESRTCLQIVSSFNLNHPLLLLLTLLRRLRLPSVNQSVC